MEYYFGLAFRRLNRSGRRIIQQALMQAVQYELCQEYNIGKSDSHIIDNIIDEYNMIIDNAEEHFVL